MSITETTTRLDRRYLNNKTKAELIDLIMQLTDISVKRDMLETRAAKVLCKAFLELNTIRARDGVPYTHMGWKSSVTEEHFSSLVDDINAVVKELTGQSAHCNPLLYKKD